MRRVFMLSAVIIVILCSCAGFSGQDINIQDYKWCIKVRQVVKGINDHTVIFLAKDYQYCERGDTTSLILTDWTVRNSTTGLQGESLELYVAPYRPYTRYSIKRIDSEDRYSDLWIF